MKPSLRLLAIFGVVLVGSASALSQRTSENGGANNSISRPSSARRSFVATGAASLAFLTAGLPLPAKAVKPRNEALCGTGFYTNIWQYRCTDLGDISDEGLVKDLSAAEATAADGLMSKLSLDIPSGSEIKTESSKQDADPKAKR